MTRVASEPQRIERRALRLLGGALARRARGPALVVHHRDAGVVAAIAERGVEVRDVDADRISDAGSKLSTFRSVVVADALEYLSQDAGDALLARVWPFVKPGGRLLVTVPNDGCASSAAHTRTFNRRRLRRALRRLGEPRLVKDQPYQWLVMYVEKAPPAGRRPNRTRRDRYRATARLCRGRVIELGSGEGHLAKAIADRGHEVVGVELSLRKVETAVSNFPEIPFLHQDILQLDEPDESFDTVVLAEVLEHVDAECGTAMLERAWGMLRPRGRLIVSVPNEDCIPHRNHVREFDRRGLARILSRWGRPRLVAEQPFQWLMMYVDKQRGGRS